MFDHKGVLSVDPKGKDPDELALEIIDLGADDVKVDNRLLEVYTVPADLHKMQQALEQKKMAYESAELEMVPKNPLELAPSEAAATVKLIEILEELDDVQKVWGNFEIDDADIPDL